MVIGDKIKVMMVVGDKSNYDGDNGSGNSDCDGGW